MQSHHPKALLISNICNGEFLKYDVQISVMWVIIETTNLLWLFILCFSQQVQILNKSLAFHINFLYRIQKYVRNYNQRRPLLMAEENCWKLLPWRFYWQLVNSKSVEWISINNLIWWINLPFHDKIWWTAETVSVGPVCLWPGGTQCIME